jgi:AAA+ superfamily predicted ATPase
MTTNRVGIFDKAIHSRINVALKYKDLDEEARRAVWRTFLPPNSLRDTAIKRLAKHQANWREIKNCVRTASIMANYRKETLSIEHLETVLNLGMQLSEDCARG